MKECKIRGPYLPVGDTDWTCVQHKVDARLKEQIAARIEAGLQSANEVKRADFYCPVGEMVLSLEEAGVEITDEALRDLIEHFNAPEPVEINFNEFGWGAIFDPPERVWEMGDYRPRIYEGESDAIRGMRPQMMFVDEAQSVFDAADPAQLIGAQISLRYGNSLHKVTESINKIPMPNFTRKKSR